MLRRAAASLLGQQQVSAAFGGVANYATATKDYTLALQGAYDLVKQSESSIQPKEASYTTGAPLETFQRMARIYTPAKTASQSGFARTIHPSSNSPAWKIEFDTTDKWINPLMGWTSTADTLENVGRSSLFFYTKDEAMAFCTKHGWQFTVDEPSVRRTSRQKRYSAYADNFSIKRKGVPDLSTLPSNRAR